MKKYLLLTILLGALMHLWAQTPATYVNPMIGTGGHGHTYPGALRPFGMVQVSPDTRLTGWDGCSAYHHSDSIVYGFSHTHLSGTGCSDYGDVLIMPFVKKNAEFEATYNSRFSHSTEVAQPGYYAVKLENDNILAELTATPRTAMHRYTFPESKTQGILIDLRHRDVLLDCDIKMTGSNKIEGFRRSKAWANDQHVYFVIEFNQPFKGPMGKITGKDGRMEQLFLNFSVTKPLLVKVGISGVSIEGAKENLLAENRDWDFDAVRKQAFEEWDRELSKIQVEGGAKTQTTIFYSALYHCMSAPNLWSDINGKYRGRNGKVKEAQDGEVYTVFSLWDTYRGEHPLLSILDEARTNDFIRTFIHQYEDGGALPVWELSANETYCMIGYHAVPVIWDAFQKGIRDYDVKKAFEAMVHSANLSHYGLDAYRTQGHIPFDVEHESVSKTLEYAYDDWCIAQMAQALGKEKEYQEFSQRAQYWQNLYDRETGFFRARKNGGWYAPFNPAEVNNNYTEANAWQYLFAAQHDISGFAEMMGGKGAFEKKLDELFTTTQSLAGREQADITGLIGQYAHGNEPSHHIAYLYNYTDSAWKSQKLVFNILQNFYQNNPDGLIGNEDCGQMSAWYVLSAMGFYPVCPGSGRYEWGSPMFDKVTIHTLTETPFVIQVKKTSTTAPNVYTQSMQWNGKPYKNLYLLDEMVREGGKLEVVLGDKPSTLTDWVAPVSTTSLPMTISPLINAASNTFRGSQEISLAYPIATTEKVALYYTLDEKTPDKTAKLYDKPFSISTNTTVKVIAYIGDKQSFPVEGRFYRIPDNVQVSLQNCKYSSQYTAGGEVGLVNGVRGKLNWRTGDWMGFQGQDIEILVDLGKEMQIQDVSAGFLQDVGSWIVMPSAVQFWVAGKDFNFVRIKEVQNDVPIQQTENTIKEFAANYAPSKKVRYVKVIAKNAGKLPEWHLGAGGESFIFIDEITIKEATK